jgi:hypothetical protein
MVLLLNANNDLWLGWYSCNAQGIDWAGFFLREWLEDGLPVAQRDFLARKRGGHAPTYSCDGPYANSHGSGIDKPIAPYHYLIVQFEMDRLGQFAKILGDRLLYGN